MPSVTHQNLLLLFREHLELVIDFARVAGARTQRYYDTLEAVDTEFEDPVHPGRTVRADLLVVASDAGRAKAAIVLEVELGEDPNKLWSMLLCRAVARYRHRCPAQTLVFSPFRRVITWVRHELFANEPELTPLVITPEMIPPVTDRMLALADYPRAILSVIMHGDGPDAVACVTVTIQALLRVAPRELGRYVQLVASSVSEEVMQHVRQQLPNEDEEALGGLQREWERRSSTCTRGLGTTGH